MACFGIVRVFIQETAREQWLDFLALSETGRSNFANHFLDRLAAGLDFAWYILPPQGRSGGMLVGFNRVSLQVKNVNVGDFLIKFHFRTKVMVLSGLWFRFTEQLKMTKNMNFYPN